MAEGAEGSASQTRRARARLAWGLGTLAALLGLLLLAGAVRGVSIPLLAAFIVAYFLAPVVKALAKRKVPPPLAIVLILLTALLVVAGLLAVLGPRLAAEFADLPAKLEQMCSRVMVWAEARFDVDLADPRALLKQFVTENFASLPKSAVAEPAGDVLRAVLGGAANTLSVLIGLVMTLVFTFFMLLHFDSMIAAVHGLIPPRYREFVGARAREIDRAMSSFLRGQITVASIMAVLYTIGFLIVGVPLAAAVGLIAGLGNMIPYLGTTVGLTLATGLVLLEEPTWPMLLGTWGVFVAVQALEGWVITPKVIGESLDLSPFVVIVAVMAFGELFGFVGVLVAVPLTAVLKILGRSVLVSYRESAFFTESSPDE